MAEYTTRKTGNEPTAEISPAGARRPDQATGARRPQQPAPARPANKQATPTEGVSPADTHAGETGIPAGQGDEEPTGLPNSDRHQTETAPHVQSGDQNDRPTRATDQTRGQR